MADLEDLISVLDNSQVSWIIDDEDVNQFYKLVLKQANDISGFDEEKITSLETMLSST